MNSLYSKHFEILCYRIIRRALFSVPLLSDRQEQLKAQICKEKNKLS